MMDEVMYYLFDNCENPLELAVRFLFVIILFDAIFGIAGVCLGAFRPRYKGE